MSKQFAMTAARLGFGSGIGGNRLRSPAVGALVMLCILLGKAIVCSHAPNRAVLFDAMLMVPVSMLAFHDGLVTGLVSGAVAAAADVVLTAKMAQITIPLYLMTAGTGTAVLARLLSMEVVASIVVLLTYRTRARVAAAEKRAAEYLRKINMLEKHTEVVEQTARHQQAEFEQNLLRYSSLVYLLEESAQKIYSNLESDQLFQSIFRVLEECFGATCSSVYLKDSESGTYFLAGASGAEHAPPDAIPMTLDSGSVIVRELEKNRRAVCWQEMAEPTGQAPGVISGTLLEKGEPMGIINVHAAIAQEPPDLKLLVMVCNIASIAVANAKLFGEVQWLARHDALTKVYNRRMFHERLESQIAACTGPDGPSGEFALLMLDIDHFKSFNDTYGHQAGDAVLVWFAAHCEECAGLGNPVFRYGGEEFTIIMPRSEMDESVRIAETIRSRVERTVFHYEGADLRVTLSCGAAVYPHHASNGDELVRKADRAMYKAKELGRNAVVVSESTGGQETTPVPYEVKTAATAREGRVVLPDDLEFSRSLKDPARVAWLGEREGAKSEN